jgi:hypothetical protein
MFSFYNWRNLAARNKFFLLPGTCTVPGIWWEKYRFLYQLCEQPVLLLLRAALQPLVGLACFRFFSLQFRTFIFCGSSSTWFSHLNLGLPTGRDEHGSNPVNFLTVLGEQRIAASFSYAIINGIFYVLKNYPTGGEKWAYFFVVVITAKTLRGY